jgi:hypothetical protein
MMNSYINLRKIIFLLGILITVSSVNGQNFVYPIIKQKGLSIKDFVPSGWVILDSATGDLNNDKQPDAAVILQYRDSVSVVRIDGNYNDTFITQPRILIVLFKSANKNYFYLAEQNNTFILTHDSPLEDDPYLSLKIDKEVLQIKFQWYPYSGTWYVNNSLFKFRLKGSEFILIGVDESWFNRASHDFKNCSYNFITNKIFTEEGNDDNKTKKIEWKTIKNKKVESLKSIEHLAGEWMESGDDL